MYPDYMAESLRKVAQTRPARLELARKPAPVYPPMNAEERRAVLEGFHPDFESSARRVVREAGKPSDRSAEPGILHPA